MAVGPVYFQPLSPEQANPGLWAAQQRALTQGQLQDNIARMYQNMQLGAQVPYAGQMAQQDLLKSQLANALQQNTLNYAPQTSQANIDLTKAQTGAQSALPGLYSSEAQRNNADTGLINQQKLLYLYSIADPATKLMIGRKIMMSGGFPGADGTQSPAPQGGQQASNQPMPPAYGQGASMPPLPGGGGFPNGIPMRPQGAPTPAYMQPSVQQPGALPQQPSIAPAFGGNGGAMQLPNPDALYNIMYNNQIKGMSKDPMFGSMRGGEGGTYTSPYTNETISTDTSKNTTLDQGTVASVARAKPLIDSLVNNLAPFQTAGAQGRLGIGSALNYLSPDFAQSVAPNLAALPGQKAAGEQALKIAPEALLRAWGLPPTNESLQRVQEAVEPRFGETPAQYRSRLNNFMGELRQNSLQAQQRLKSGMNVDGQAGSSQTSQPQISASKILGGVTYHKINGQWYAQ